MSLNCQLFLDFHIIFRRRFHNLLRVSRSPRSCSGLPPCSSGGFSLTAILLPVPSHSPRVHEHPNVQQDNVDPIVHRPRIGTSCAIRITTTNFQRCAIKVIGSEHVAKHKPPVEWLAEHAGLILRHIPNLDANGNPTTTRIVSNRELLGTHVVGKE